MNELNKKAWEGIAQFFVAMLLLIFLPAWTLHYWQAWIFLAAFFVPVLAITIYLMRNDPQLLARRVNAGPSAEKEKKQKVIQSLAALAFIATFIVSGIDHRLGWSSVSAYTSGAGDIIVILGLLVVFFVFRENSFTSATIEVGAEQKIIATGPYALVRHPMYAGAFIMLVGVPLALGSWWGLVAVFLLMLSIVWRLLDEERFLIQNLSGYSEYRKKVRHRLVPFVW